MITYKLHRDPYDCEILFTGKLERELKPGITILVGCNGSGKSTILHALKEQCRKNPDFKVFRWDGRYDKSTQKDVAMEAQRYDILASLSFSSEGEEINTNIGILASQIGNFLRKNQDKNLLILLDGLDSGLSIDNIIEVKDFFKEFIIPDVAKTGHECYIVIPANEYEMANGERCVDARTGKEIYFEDYEHFRNFVLVSREKKDNRKQTKHTEES